MTELEVKIKELKEAKVAHIIAENFDSVPNSKKAEKVIEDYFDYNLEDLRRIMDEYEDMGTVGIERVIFEMIDEL